VLSSLPLRLQVVLTLHYLEGMKVTEIAQVLNCPVGTVKSRLSEGRARMGERLNQRDF
jgi:RNA polymerase sigma-70 factor, ECF subfamily